MIPMGMQLTAAEAVQYGPLDASVAQVPAIAITASKRPVCSRCLQGATARLQDGRLYCADCLGLGRITEDMVLLRQPVKPAAPMAVTLNLPGPLTPAQEEAASAVQHTVARGDDHLVWAVTGAGKTEMMLPAVRQVLAGGGRVAWVAPRVDVVRELAPRLARAFPDVPVTVRYQGQPWPSTTSSLLVATTHQLLRYYQAFELVIVDEVDAFPYPATPMLAAGVRQAATGSVVYLSATPAVALQRTLSNATSRLWRRFHGFDLPVPSIQLVKQVLPLPRRGLQRVHQALSTSQQLLVFVPNLKWLAVLGRQLADHYPTKTVHAAQLDREAVVLAFREQQFRVLVTTTILERGVTIPSCAVMVVGADNPLFDAASLIQISGRAGRAKTAPNDAVWFSAKHVTRAMLAAIAVIRRQNRHGGS